jgi:hypothetical protein
MIFNLIAAMEALQKKIAFQKLRKSLSILHHFGKPVAMPVMPFWLLFVVVHIVPPNRRNEPLFCIRLQQCIDALLRSFDGFPQKIVILT